MGDFIGCILLGIVSAGCFVLSFLQFNEKGVLLNNAYIYASKKERSEMDKKPYYRQSATVFAFLGVIFFLETLDTLLKTSWLFYCILAVATVTIVYAVASTVIIEKRKS